MIGTTTTSPATVNRPTMDDEMEPVWDKGVHQWQKSFWTMAAASIR